LGASIQEDLICKSSDFPKEIEGGSSWLPQTDGGSVEIGGGINIELSKRFG
jgi:hypothetical protein